MDFGSLLGAVRNSRAIPWDGDFDLSTLESDKIVNNKHLLDDLINKGYEIHITYANIKILKRDWTFGQYMLDIHSNQLVYLEKPELVLPERKDNRGPKPKRLIVTE